MTDQTAADQTAGPTPMTFDDFRDSLVESEEIAIEQHYGDTLEGLLIQLRRRGGIKLSRAVLFVFKLREGLPPSKAKSAVGKMTRQQLNAESDRYLCDDDPGDVDPDNPRSELGKDDDASD